MSKYLFSVINEITDFPFRMNNEKKIYCIVIYDPESFYSGFHIVKRKDSICCMFNALIVLTKWDLEFTLEITSLNWMQVTPLLLIISVFTFFFFSLRENMSNLHIYFTVSTTQHVLMSLGKLRTLFKIKYTFYTKKSLALWL